MKKKLALLLAGVLLVGTLGGCGAASTGRRKRIGRGQNRLKASRHQEKPLSLYGMWQEMGRRLIRRQCWMKQINTFWKN